MTDLRNTIAHILEHKQHLAKVNEATTQQYVVLPILRALGWDDANLASMEVLPEYAVENGHVDYALKIGQTPKLFIECKKWDEPLKKHESQIANYAFNAGVPIGVLTNGKIWYFYFSWVEGKPVAERIFCEIDIGNLENAVSNLETYLLISNVTSERAKQNAQKALNEKERTGISEISPTVPNPNPVDDVIDNPSEKRPATVLPESDVEGTIDMVRNSLPSEFTVHYEKTYSGERCKLFYIRLAELLNLIKKEGWELQQKPSKIACNFWLEDERVFGLRINFNPPRLRVKITEEDAEKFSRQHGCQVASYSKSQKNAYYSIPEDLSELLPVLKFAYKKHTGN